MSDTPRTDVIVNRAVGNYSVTGWMFELEELARDLERELTAEKQRSERLEKVRDAAMILSTEMVEAEALGADFSAVDKEWEALTAALKEQSRE